MKKEINTAIKAGREAGKNTREQFGLIGGLARILFGRKKVIIDRKKGFAYEIYDF